MQACARRLARSRGMDAIDTAADFVGFYKPNMGFAASPLLTVRQSIPLSPPLSKPTRNVEEVYSGLFAFNAENLVVGIPGCRLLTIHGVLMGKGCVGEGSGDRVEFASIADGQRGTDHC